MFTKSQGHSLREAIRSGAGEAPGLSKGLSVMWFALNYAKAKMQEAALGLLSALGCCLEERFGSPQQKNLAGAARRKLILTLV